MQYRNKKHVAWIHEHECRLAGIDCDGPIQAHHLLKPWDGHRGMGMKANDKNLMPLCEGHHRALHLHGGEEAFFEERAGSANYGRLSAQQLWLSSPHFELDPNLIRRENND